MAGSEKKSGPVVAWDSWVQFPASPQTSCVTLDKSLHFTGPQFPLCKMGIIALSTSHGCCEDKYYTIVRCSGTRVMESM